MASTTAFETPSGDDKQTKITDHSSSDIGSVPTPSQAVVLVSDTKKSRSFSHLARILAAFSLASFLAPAIYLRSVYDHSHKPIDPTDYVSRTKRVLSQVPLIDGHNDLPYLVRVELRNKIYDGFTLDQKLLGHTDLQRMRTGQVGGQFWSCYVECPGVVNPELYKQENLDQPTVRHSHSHRHSKNLISKFFQVDCSRHAGAN